MTEKFTRLGAFMMLAAPLVLGATEVTTWPIPEGIAVSEDYRVTVEGADVPVMRTPDTEYRPHFRQPTNHYSYAQFDAAGEVEVKVEWKGGSETFCARPPFKRVFQPFGRDFSLVLAANEPERDLPVRNAPNVVYFGPGRHRADLTVLKSGETLYLAGGALLEGAVYANGTNITIRGRGILSGAPWPWKQGPTRTPKSDQINLDYGILALVEGKDNVVRDIVLWSGWCYHLVLNEAEGCVVDNVKVLGGRVLNDDGIDPCRCKDLVIRNSFVHTQDDCLAPKFWIEGMTVSNMTLWSDCATPIRVGYECDKVPRGFRNLVFRDLDFLRLTRLPTAMEAYWARPAIQLQATNDTMFDGFLFEDIRIAAAEPTDTFLVFRTQTTTQTFLYDHAGTARNVIFRNIALPSLPGGIPSLVSAHDREHPISGVRFENVTGLGAVKQMGPVQMFDTDRDFREGGVRPASLETEIWQGKIDAVAATGGGRVVVPSGVHPIGTIHLKSGVTLELAKDAVLLGSPDFADYADVRIEYAEIREPWQALVIADGQRDVAIVGEGVIDGNGAKFPYDTRLGRPCGLVFHKCRNVRIEGVTLREPARWTCYLKECDGVTVRRVKVDSHANGNNDGIDIDSRNVLVEDCVFDSDDDAIVLKCDNPNFCVENVEIRNCEARSCCSTLKLGTGSHGGFRNITVHDVVCGASARCVRNPKSGRVELSEYRVSCWPGAKYDPAPISGIVIESVDGAGVDNIIFRNIDIREATVPIFIRGGLRAKRLWGDVELGIPLGRECFIRNVLIENVKARQVSYTANSITGIPGVKVANVTLRNVEISVPGAGDEGLEEIGRPVPEKGDAFPESNMFDNRMLPAYGFYIRQADGIVFDNVKIAVRGLESRPEVVTENVTGFARHGK